MSLACARYIQLVPSHCTHSCPHATHTRTPFCSGRSPHCADAKPYSTEVEKLKPDSTFSAYKKITENFKPVLRCATSFLCVPTYLSVLLSFCTLYDEDDCCYSSLRRRFFTEFFSSPSDWFERRLAYTRSVAASSIVGYVLGLGDRHPHNILINTQTAELVHIDLGVAFGQVCLPETPQMKIVAAADTICRICRVSS